MPAPTGVTTQGLGAPREPRAAPLRARDHTGGEHTGHRGYYDDDETDEFGRKFAIVYLMDDSGEEASPTDLLLGGDYVLVHFEHLQPFVDTGAGPDQ